MQRELVEVSLSDVALEAPGFKNCRQATSSLLELKDSIVRDGLLTPPTVWFREEEPTQVLISGHRRFQALKEIIEDNPEFAEAFETLWVTKYEGDLNTALAINISENVHREDLNPADRAEAVYRLVDRLGTQTEAAKVLNKSDAWVSQQCQIVKYLIPEGMEALRNKQITQQQAIALSKFMIKETQQPDVEKQLELLNKLLHKQESVPSESVRSYRLKSEIEELRVLLSDNEENHVPGQEIHLEDGHKASLTKVIQWYFREIDLDELLRAPVDETREFEVPMQHTKERVRT